MYMYILQTFLHVQYQSNKSKYRTVTVLYLKSTTNKPTVNQFSGAVHVVQFGEVYVVQCGLHALNHKLLPHSDRVMFYFQVCCVNQLIKGKEGFLEIHKVAFLFFYAQQLLLFTSCYTYLVHSRKLRMHITTHAHIAHNRCSR